MCSAFGLCILNSSCKGDLHGCYTYVTGLGCSVIDCFIASEELYYMLLPSSELTVAERIKSNHFLVGFKIAARKRDTVGIAKHFSFFIVGKSENWFYFYCLSIQPMYKNKLITLTQM